MFRPSFYHPRPKPSTPFSPAGFRFENFSPRRCFNLFQGPGSPDARSPDPSPLTSPVRGAGCTDDDAPPTARLADVFPDVFVPPQRPAAPPPFHNPQNAAKPNGMPAAGNDPLRNLPQPRRKYKSPKQLSFEKNHSPPHRRAPQFKQKEHSSRKKHHDGHDRRTLKARDAFTRLCREAETLMKPEHMTAEDRIFMKQLRNLELDQKLEYDLEEYRERMARAKAETRERRRAHAAMDAEAAKLRREQPDEEADKEQKRKVEAFVKAEEEVKETHFRQVEEEAMRVDEERQRAHQAAERKAREEQERLFHEQQTRKVQEEGRRQQEEQARKAQEEERRREEQARKAQEEERRQREERARKAMEEERRRWKERERLLREQRERQEQAEKERERRLREEKQRLREEVERARAAQRRAEEGRRQMQEEIERTRREAQGRFFTEQKARGMRDYDDIMREERERFAREREARARAEEARRAAEEEQRRRAERARRAAEEERIRQCFALYEAKWNELRTSNSIPPIDVREMPWPVFGVVSSVDQITYEGVKTFLFHPLRPGVEGKTARDKVKSEVLRFHPDKFNTRIVPKIQPCHQAVAQQIAGAVARILTTVMAEEDQQK